MNSINLENLGSGVEKLSTFCQTSTGHLGNVAAGATAATAAATAVMGFVDFWRSNPERARLDQLTQCAEERAKENEEYNKQQKEEFEKALERDEERDKKNRLELQEVRIEHDKVLKETSQKTNELTKEYQKNVLEMQTNFQKEMASKELSTKEEQDAIEKKYEEKKIETKKEYESKIKQEEEKMKAEKAKFDATKEKLEKERENTQSERLREEKEHRTKMEEAAKEFHRSKVEALKEQNKLRKKIMETEKKRIGDFQNARLAQIQQETRKLASNYKDQSNRRMLGIVQTDFITPAVNVTASLKDINDQIKLLQRGNNSDYKTFCQISAGIIESNVDVLKSNLNRFETDLINNAETNPCLRNNVRCLMRSMEESIDKTRDVSSLRMTLQMNDLTYLDECKTSLDNARISFETIVNNYRNLNTDEYITNLANEIGQETAQVGQIESSSSTQDVLPA